MRITFVANITYSPGKWQRFDLIVDHLRKLGNEIFIVSFEEKKSFRGQIEPQDRVYRIHPPRMLRMIDAFLYAILGFSTTTFSLMCSGILSRLRSDVVMVHGNVEAMLTITLMKPLLFPRAKVVYDMNDLIARMGSYSRKGFLRRFVVFLDEVFLPRRADRVLTVTRFGKAYLAGRGVPEDRILVLNELVDIERFRHVDRTLERELRAKLGISDDEKVLLWHGFVRGYQVRAIETLIRAIGFFYKNGKGVKASALVVGPISPRDEAILKGLAAEMGATVRFTGRVPAAHIPHYISLAAIGVQPLPDTLFARYINSVKLAEYVAGGRPVLCSALEGPSELISGNGLLFKPDDAADLAKRIGEILSMDEKELSRRSLEIADLEFSPTSIERKMKGLLEFLGS